MSVNEEGTAGSALSHVYPLYIIGFTVQMGMGIVAPVLPDLMRDFSLSALQVGMVITSFGLARLATDLPLGLLLDRVKRAYLLVFGASLIVAGSMAAALSQDYGVLLVARFVMGVGSAFCTVTALFSLSQAAGDGSRGRAIGTYQAAMLGGNSFSPAIGGLIAAAGGWRSSFLFCSATGAIALLVILFAARQGSLSFAPTAKKSAERQQSSVRRTRVHWDLVAIDFTTFVLYFSLNGFNNGMVPVFGGSQLGIGTATLGLMLAVASLIRFAVTLGSGYVSDRYGRKVVMVPGMLLLAAGSIGFTFVHDLPGFFLSLAVLSLGGFGNSVPTTMVVDAVGAGRAGLAISVNRCVGDAGVLLGPAILGWIFDSGGFSVAASATVVLLLATIPGVVFAVRERPRSAAA
ncbi:MAG: MFS transporter [Chloroflexota bacterium]